MEGLSSHERLALDKEQELELDWEETLNRHTTSIFTSKDIPLSVRYAIPVIVVVNIAFFMSGHLHYGAQVNLSVKFAGQVVSLDKFARFRVLNTIVDLWTNDATSLAIIMTLCSVVWPYAKQFITLALWMLPPSTVSVPRRGRILLWLDAFSKWSMIDIFVMILFFASFRMSIMSPDFAFLPEDFYRLELRLIIQWGIYANMLAQIISQVSSHFIIHYHRRIVENTRKKYDRILKQRIALEENNEVSSYRSEGTDQQKPAATTLEEMLDFGSGFENEEEEDYVGEAEAIHRHAFLVPHRTDGKQLTVRFVFHVLFIGLILVTACLVIMSSSLSIYDLDVLGIFGVAIEVGQNFQAASTSYSVFGFASFLMTEARLSGGLGDRLGSFVLTMLIVGSVFLVPLLLLFALLYQWYSRMNLARRNRVAVLIEILLAWQYMEVFLLATVVAIWQISPISSFMFSGFCENLEDGLAAMAYYGIIQEEDAQCLRLKGSVGSASYTLVIAATVLTVLTTLVQKAVTQYVHDKTIPFRPTRTISENTTREDEEEDKLDTKPVRFVPLEFTDLCSILLREPVSEHAEVDVRTPKRRGRKEEHIEDDGNETQASTPSSNRNAHSKKDFFIRENSSYKKSVGVDSARPKNDKTFGFEDDGNLEADDNSIFDFDKIESRAKRDSEKRGVLPFFSAKTGTEDPHREEEAPPAQEDGELDVGPQSPPAPRAEDETPIRSNKNDRNLFRPRSLSSQPTKTHEDSILSFYS